MITTLFKEEREQTTNNQTPYLSYSRINRYLYCPEQYRLYYLENLRPVIPSASLVFGQVLHQALAHLFSGKDDLQGFFESTWNDVKQIDLDYNQKESWEKLKDVGHGLLEQFQKEELPRLSNIKASEKVFEIAITSLNQPFIGVIDLIADLDEKYTVVDFKTSGTSYGEHEVILSDQLTAYQLAEPDAEQTALCVLIKTKQPKIEWHRARRTGDQFTEFLMKINYLAHEISIGHFYKRHGKWCAGCDYLPVCSGDLQKAKDTLVTSTMSAAYPSRD